MAWIIRLIYTDEEQLPIILRIPLSIKLATTSEVAVDLSPLQGVLSNIVSLRVCRDSRASELVPVNGAFQKVVLEAGRWTV
jgi:hypothetical protein